MLVIRRSQALRMDGRVSQVSCTIVPRSQVNSGSLPCRMALRKSTPGERTGINNPDKRLHRLQSIHTKLFRSVNSEFNSSYFECDRRMNTMQSIVTPNLTAK